MNFKRALLLTTSAAAALALVGCGGDDSGKQRNEWAKKVCDQVQPQARKIKQANTAITEATESRKPPAEVKKTDAAAFQQISEAFAALAKAVDGAGDPPVDEGKQLRQEAVKELNGMSTSYRELKETVDKLKTDDQAEFAEGLKQVAARLQKLSRSGDDALSTLQSGELGKAIAKQDSCRDTTASPSRKT